MTSQEIEKYRLQTPGCNQNIHFNNAGAALLTATTLKAIVDCLNEEALQGSYETEAKFASKLNDFYNQAAKLINAKVAEIAYTESATVAWQRAFFAIDFNPGDEIICDHATYASSYISFLVAEQKFGTKAVVIGATTSGDIDLDALESAISDKTKLLAITHIPTNSGLVNQAEEVGSIAEKYGLLYLLDACQSVGQYPVDVQSIKCDFLSTTGRKYLRGPRGTGFLFIKEKHISKLTPFSLDLHSATWTSPTSFESLTDAKKFETWESNIAAKLGLTSALEQLNEIGIDIVWEQVQHIASYFRKQLAGIPKITVHDIGTIQCGIVTFSHKEFSCAQVKKYLTSNKINTVTPVKSGALIDMSERNLEQVIRASVHYYNTKEEIDTFVATLSKL